MNQKTKEKTLKETKNKIELNDCSYIILYEDKNKETKDIIKDNIIRVFFIVCIFILLMKVY